MRRGRRSRWLCSRLWAGPDAQRFLAAFICACLWADAARAQQPAAPARPIRALIVTGMDIHDWKSTAPALATGMEKDSRIKTTMMQDPHELGASPLDDYDVVVLHFMNWKAASPGEAARTSLRKFVEGGKGLVLVHFACGAWQDWPEFRNLAGRVWDPRLRAHDPRGPFKVDIVNREHPITQGLDSFETTDELYTCLAGERPIEILATARSKVDGKDHPMAFCFHYGGGRVFHCVLGHDAKALASPPAAELFRRGAAWAAGCPPSPPAR